MLAACGGEMQEEGAVSGNEGQNAGALRRGRLKTASATSTPTTTTTTTTTTTSIATTVPTTSTTPTPTATTSTLLSDDFTNGSSRWTDWYASPGWVYSSNAALAITPGVATHPAPTSGTDYDYTHAAIASYCPSRNGTQCSNGSTWGNVAYESRVNTLRQTRLAVTGNEPNGWEVAWLMFRFKDERHYYYMHFKSHHLRDMNQDYGGIEIGKYNCSSSCGLYEQQAGQEVIWNITANDLAGTGISYLTLNQWYDYRIETRDVVLADGTTGVNIIVKINGIQVANVTDDGKQLGMGHSTPTPPITGGSGSMALYSEDAAVLFDDVKVTPLP